MARPQVPKFGNWESEEDVAYSFYFDNARRGTKGGKMNPNDPKEYLDAKIKGQKVPEATRPKHVRRTGREDGHLRRSVDSPWHSDAPSKKSPNESPHSRHDGLRYACTKSETKGTQGPDVVRPKHKHQLGREEGDFRRPTVSLLQNVSANPKTSYDSPHHRYGGLNAGDTPKRVARQSVGSSHNIEHPPQHPHAQARTGGKGSGGVSSPSWERKGSSEGGGHGLAPSTPRRSRLRSITQGNETPDHNLAVPKFGDWDETDPTSAEGYTQIFNRVREEKHSGTEKVAGVPTETSYSNAQKRIGNDNSKSFWCFPCGR